MELFDIRSAIKEVCDIMRFQIDSKGLQLAVEIDEKVPKLIMCDPKRYK